jgi:ABC-type amino acid transport substrate-binding protein
LVISVLGWSPIWAQEAVTAPIAKAALPPPITAEEQAWLDTHPVIRYGADPNWPPFTKQGANGQLGGIDLLMLNEILPQLKVKFLYVPTLNWSDTVKSYREGKIDVLLATAHTKVRESDFLFTKPYFEFPVAIVWRTPRSATWWRLVTRSASWT